jgi:hypothetical protein
MFGRLATVCTTSATTAVGVLQHDHIANRPPRCVQRAVIAHGKDAGIDQPVGKFRDMESARQLELADLGAARIERLGLKDMPGALNFDLLRWIFCPTYGWRENERNHRAGD